MAQPQKWAMKNIIVLVALFIAHVSPIPLGYVAEQNNALLSEIHEIIEELFLEDVKNQHCMNQKLDNGFGGTQPGGFKPNNFYNYPYPHQVYHSPQRVFPHPKTHKNVPIIYKSSINKYGNGYRMSRDVPARKNEGRREMGKSSTDTKDDDADEPSSRRTFGLIASMLGLPGVGNVQQESHNTQIVQNIVPSSYRNHRLDSITSDLKSQSEISSLKYELERQRERVDDENRQRNEIRMKLELAARERERDREEDRRQHEYEMREKEAKLNAKYEKNALAREKERLQYQLQLERDKLEMEKKLQLESLRNSQMSSMNHYTIDMSPQVRTGPPTINIQQINSVNKPVDIYNNIKTHDKTKITKYNKSTSSSSSAASSTSYSGSASSSAAASGGVCRRCLAKKNEKKSQPLSQTDEKPNESDDEGSNRRALGIISTMMAVPNNLILGNLGLPIPVLNNVQQQQIVNIPPQLTTFDIKNNTDSLQLQSNLDSLKEEIEIHKEENEKERKERLELKKKLELVEKEREIARSNNTDIKEQELQEKELEKDTLKQERKITEPQPDSEAVKMAIQKKLEWEALLEAQNSVNLLLGSRISTGKSGLLERKTEKELRLRLDLGLTDDPLSPRPNFKVPAARK